MKPTGNREKESLNNDGYDARYKTEVDVRYKIEFDVTEATQFWCAI